MSAEPLTFHFIKQRQCGQEERHPAHSGCPQHMSFQYVIFVVSVSQLGFTAEESRSFSEFRLQAERLLCAGQKSEVKQGWDAVESELDTVEKNYLP